MPCTLYKHWIVGCMVTHTYYYNHRFFVSLPGIGNEITCAHMDNVFTVCVITKNAAACTKKKTLIIGLCEEERERKVSSLRLHTVYLHVQYMTLCVISTVISLCIDLAVHVKPWEIPDICSFLLKNAKRLHPLGQRLYWLLQWSRQDAACMPFVWAVGSVHERSHKLYH